MANASFSWIEANTTAGSKTVPTNLNLGSTKVHDLAPSTYPITAGSVSYSKWIKGYWSGTFTRIENLQFWMSSSGTGYKSGETLWCSATTASYNGTDGWVAPTDAVDVQADNAMPIADPAARNVGFAGSLTASITSSGYSDFIVIQASVTSAASAGTTATKEFRLQYDEV